MQLAIACVFTRRIVGQEDVKKLIWRSFRDFSFEPKCIPTSHRSLLGHNGAALGQLFSAPNSLSSKKSFFFTSSI
jgi:hypothetical protein